MKRMIVILCAIMFCLYSYSQDNPKVSVFVLYDNQDTRNISNYITDLLVNYILESNNYIALNRSDELNRVLHQVHLVNESGIIDVKQVVNATKGYAEDLVVGVYKYELGAVSVYQATMMDVETQQIIKTASSSVASSALKDNSKIHMTCNSIAKDIAQRLFGVNNDKVENSQEQHTKLQQEIHREQRREAREKHREEINSEISKYSYLGVTPFVGASYPWTSPILGLTGRVGTKWIGIGGYLDFGMHMGDDGITQNDAEVDITFMVAGGLQLYFCEGFNIDVGYGTLPITPTYVEKGYDKYIYLPNQGLFFRLGYQQVWGGIMGLEFGIGGVYNFLTNEMLVSASFKYIINCWGGNN